MNLIKRTVIVCLAILFSSDHNSKLTSWGSEYKFLNLTITEYKDVFDVFIACLYPKLSMSNKVP